MKKIYLPIIALAIGFANACLAFQVRACFSAVMAGAVGIAGWERAPASFPYHLKQST